MSAGARPWRLPALLGQALVWATAALTPAAALEQPALLTEDDLRVGAPMSPVEMADANQFCQETLARSAVPPDSLSRTCACFTLAWEARTNRLHRLVLPITLAPDAPQSRRNIAMIMREQGGVHEDRLKQLSTEYEIAAKQAFRACR